MIVKGRTHLYGDNIDTDRIIPGKYTKTLDMSDLANHVLEDLDPEFRTKVKQGDILVAGDNFGCGSSREQAPLALQAAGISAVVAQSFARIFFRNAINIGLPVIEAPDHTIADGDDIEIDFSEGNITNASRQEQYQGTQMPDVMINILAADGLVNFLKENGKYELS
ncbi:3-isopropylmalate dehydratase [Bhargavaea cecembensis]|uniref:3-isopropylmalate dehydratase small subunit n=1 Tax=Bhargavaea cecembensis TaxID=394098 RepID=A0A161ST72_9BACL|nr:3-isopropylmalate dehydratase small subunit [Bhargavaea cecembensis]KZE38830.1 3-isopropylmalate dehydratase [Bhargavaea cecembensis]